MVEQEAEPKKTCFAGLPPRRNLLIQIIQIFFPFGPPQALNMVEHEAEIYARPARTWFQSEKQKKELAERSKAAAAAGPGELKPALGPWRGGSAGIGFLTLKNMSLACLCLSGGG